MLEPGQTLQLKCTTESAWEYCTWRHTSAGGSDVTTPRDCHMEWKWRKVLIALGVREMVHFLKI